MASSQVLASVSRHGGLPAGQVLGDRGGHGDGGEHGGGRGGQGGPLSAAPGLRQVLRRGLGLLHLGGADDLDTGGRESEEGG